MRLSTSLTFLAAAVCASAQGSTVCDGQNVLESCLVTTRPTEQACAQTDYQCKCDAMKSVFGCFASAGCPNDDRASATENELKAWCAYVTTTSAAPAATSSSDASEDDSATPTGSSSSDSSSSPEGSEEDGDNDDENDDNSGAAYLAINAGGVLAAIAGVVVATL